jgi:3-phytase
MFRFLLQLTILLTLIACATKKSDTLQISEAFLTERDTTDEVDSPAVWHGKEGQNWLLASAKSTAKILVYDAANGSFIKSIGSVGNEPGQLDQPNGIFVIDTLLFVVDRHNQRLQLFNLPQGKSIGMMSDSLDNPYGIFVYKLAEGTFKIYITDNYDTDDENHLPLVELDRRVRVFKCTIEGASVNFSYLNHFGDTTQQGALQVVESIFGDVNNNVLFIADEDKNQKNIKISDLDGNFSGKVIDDGLFKSEPEGIVLLPCDDHNGYWIATDQSHQENVFILFDRLDFSLKAKFTGKVTKNTDGIAITQRTFGKFNKGAFYAVHDDGSVACFDLDDIMSCL